MRETLLKRGVIYVASCNPQYLGMAIVSCESLKALSPDTNVTLFTHEEWVDDSCNIFDNIITGIPHNKRAKMWCMARTPYQETLYIDADSLVIHRDFNKIFEQLEHKEICVVDIAPMCVSDPAWEFIDPTNKEYPLWDGSFMLYKNTPLVVEFLQKWYDEYMVQISTPWIHSFTDPRWANFDMFTAWAIMKSDKTKYPTVYKESFEKYRSIKLHYLEKRFNAPHFYPSSHLSGPRVILQIDTPGYRDKWAFLYNRVVSLVENKNEVC